MLNKWPYPSKRKLVKSEFYISFGCRKVEMIEIQITFKILVGGTYANTHMVHILLSWVAYYQMCMP